MLDPVFPCLSVTDVENDHLLLQCNLDDEYNYYGLMFTIYPQDHDTESIDPSDETVWDNPDYLLNELYPALELYIRTTEMNKIVYELGNEYTKKEIISMYKIFTKFFEIVDRFQLEESEFNEDVYNDSE